VLEDDVGQLLVNGNRRSRLTSQAIYNILKIRAKDAGIPDLGPRDLRRTFVDDLLDGGADISTVHKMAGQANPATTSRYDRRGERAKQKAAQLLHVPYWKRTLTK
jgi:integrase